MMLWNALLILLLVQDPTTTLPVDSAAMAKSVRDSRNTFADRDTLLSALERVNFQTAVDVAEDLLMSEDESLRFRAAWIVADGGIEKGVEVLRSMAANRKSTLTLPIVALGRLRDTKSHELLRTLLRQELADSDRKKAAPRLGALIASLSDYGDPTDASLLAQAVGKNLDLGGRWHAEDLGRTGGSDAIPVLTEIFSARGPGWTVMAAGLGLARCGSTIAAEYVRDRLADTRGARYPDGEPSDGNNDDPNGPRATGYILDHLGVPADEQFVPNLLEIASSGRYSDRAKSLAWRALLRIDSSEHREQVLDVAWNNLTFEGALHLIALSDMGGAQTRLSAMGRGKPSVSIQAAETYLQLAITATDREKRHWRETRGYGF